MSILAITEKEFKISVLQKLSKDFIIETEVIGTHFSGKRLKIDAIIKPIKNGEWKDPNVALGIEFKSISNLKSTNNSTRWINQCIDYANTNWDKYGYIHIFSCPGLCDKLSDFSHVEEGKWFINRILSNMGVGELKVYNTYGWCLYLQDAHLIWAENRGVIEGKSWSLKRKFGSK